MKTGFRILTAAALLVVAAVCPFAPSAAGADRLATRLRRPVAVALSADGRLGYVANRHSGSISVVDLEKKQVLREFEVGKQLSDLIAVPQRSLMLATDETAHELLVLSINGPQVTVLQRLKVSPYPVTVVPSKDGQDATVASLWSRRLTFVDLPARDKETARVTGQLDLPFAPREQLTVDGDWRQIVADAFGGRLGIVDRPLRRLVGVRELPAHNIRGLAVSKDGRMLLVSHQMLNELAHTDHNDVHWGLLMSNDLRWLTLAAVLDDPDDLYRGTHMHPLGDSGRAAGDPAGLTVAADGTVVVTLAGVNEIAFGKEDQFNLQRIEVGRRPTAVVTSRDSRWAYVANTLEDSISIVDLTSQTETDLISLGPQPELTLAERGERLFYDARLSHDSWMSCHSCHPDGHTNGMLNDNLSDGSFGAPKLILSLLGRAGTAPFAWNGGAQDLSQQIRTSIHQTMQGDEEPTNDQVAALRAFLETLVAPPPIDLARNERDEAAVERGRAVFQSQRCHDCHAPPNYTMPRLYHVHTQDRFGNKHFNPPPLLGVGQRSPFLHDGRAKSLEELFLKHQHKVRNALSEQDLTDLLLFLRSL